MTSTEKNLTRFARNNIFGAEKVELFPTSMGPRYILTIDCVAHHETFIVGATGTEARERLGTLATYTVREPGTSAYSESYSVKDVPRDVQAARALGIKARAFMSFDGSSDAIDITKYVA